ncbi:MAG TPA: hypothetical protein VK636_01565, partial [Gemmatimonadaceae bacterium]|nr:hypothetical protein [Gemmatimonadaceae bacterium]
ASVAALGLAAAAGSFAVLPPEAPARGLPGYSPTKVILGKNVGDSIALGDDRVIVGAATDLPVTFTLVEYQPTNPASLPLPARCAGRLQDDRDLTRLLLRMSTMQTASVVQRGDTSWTRVSSIGFFGVTPVGRYGVNAGQFLRVGCGAFTRVNVGGRVIDATAIGDLETPGDDRARRIAAEVSAAIHVVPDAVELRAQRLDVIVTDTIAAVSPIGDTAWGWVRQTSAIANRLLGQAAMPETLTFSIRGASGNSRTLYRFKSLQPRP